MKHYISSMLLVLYLGFFARAVYSASPRDPSPPNQLVMSRAEYLDRAQAIWTAQMIGQMTGMLFEHKPASVLVDTPLVQPRGFAPVDDDYLLRSG